MTGIEPNALRLEAANRTRRRWLAGSLGVVLVALFALWATIIVLAPRWASGSPRVVVAAPCDTADPALRAVVRVVDGDTIVLDGGEKVRLIGVDTPETVDPRKPVQYFGHEASAFTTRRLQGQQVHLAYDWQRTDKYRRTLAYICLPDGELVNETIVREGFGFAYVKYPFNADLMARFRAAERQAREAGRGLWAPPSSVPATSTLEQKETPSP